MNTSNKLVGLAGTSLTGKDTLAELMVREYGYTHVSTGDMVREIARKERGSIERPVLREVADHYRHQHGAGVFVDMALEYPRPLVVTGLRSRGEADAFIAASGLLIFIDAPLEMRYERMLARHRDKEIQLSLEEFRRSEAAEWYSGEEPADFNLKYIKTIAHYVIENTYDSLDRFYAEAYRRIGIAN